MNIKEIKENLRKAYGNSRELVELLKGVFIYKVKVLEVIGSGFDKGVEYRKYLIKDSSGETCIAIIYDITYPPFENISFEDKEKLMNTTDELNMFCVVSRGLAGKLILYPYMIHNPKDMCFYQIRTSPL